MNIADVFLLQGQAQKPTLSLVDALQALAQQRQMQPPTQVAAGGIAANSNILLHPLGWRENVMTVNGFQFPTYGPLTYGSQPMGYMPIWKMYEDKRLRANDNLLRR